MREEDNKSIEMQLVAHRMLTSFYEIINLHYFIIACEILHNNVFSSLFYHQCDNGEESSRVMWIERRYRGNDMGFIMSKSNLNFL